MRITYSVLASTLLLTACSMASRADVYKFSFSGEDPLHMSPGVFYESFTIDTSRMVKSTHDIGSSFTVPINDLQSPYGPASFASVSFYGLVDFYQHPDDFYPGISNLAVFGGTLEHPVDIRLFSGPVTDPVIIVGSYASLIYAGTPLNPEGTVVITDEGRVPTVPEPSSVLLLGTGLLSAAAAGRNRLRSLFRDPFSRRSSPA